MRVSFDVNRDKTPAGIKAGWPAMRLLDFLYELAIRHDLNGKIPPAYQSPDYIRREWGTDDWAQWDTDFLLSNLIEAGLIERLPGDDASIILPDWSLTAPQQEVKKPGRGGRGGGFGTGKTPTDTEASVEDGYTGTTTGGESREGEGKFNISRLKELWNSTIPPECKRVYKIEGERARHAKARLADYSPDEVKKAIDELWHCPFVRGDNDRGWSADMDFFVRPGNIGKLLEGKYRGLGMKERKQAKMELVGSVLADGKDLYG